MDSGITDSVPLEFTGRGMVRKSFLGEVFKRQLRQNEHPSKKMKKKKSKTWRWEYLRYIQRSWGTLFLFHRLEECRSWKGLKSIPL